MAVELLALSKLKLQLLALISESRDLKDRERSAREELQVVIQKQKQREANYERKLKELFADLASHDELQRKLETKVRYLENDNGMLMQKEKELKQTMNNVVQSRETFLRHYEDSTYSLRCSIEMKDRKLFVLSEKIHEHMLLFDSIEKEAADIKKVVENVHYLIKDKEGAVNELKEKVEKVSTFEKDFVEKIGFLEKKLIHYQHQLQRKDATISELTEHLEAEKNNNLQLKIGELQKMLLVKEEEIQTLTSEKQILHLERYNLELSLQKVHDNFIEMYPEGQKVMSSVLEGQEACEITSREEN